MKWLEKIDLHGTAVGKKAAARSLPHRVEPINR
jgi:hypothetical protein